MCMYGMCASLDAEVNLCDIPQFLLILLLRQDLSPSLELAKSARMGIAIKSRDLMVYNSTLLDCKCVPPDTDFYVVSVD